MLNIKITFSPITPAPPVVTVPQIVTLIRWDNQIALDDGYGTPNRLGADGKLVGQFCMSPVYVTDTLGNWAGTWAENTLGTKLTPAELLKIASLQIEDVVNGVRHTVKSKMGWACAASIDSGWGSPINTKGQDYDVATDIKMIPTCYAGQPVTLTGETMDRKITLNQRTNIERLYEVKTYQPHEWTRSNCQTVTAVSASNVYTENTKGIIKLPVYAGNRRMWILERWIAR
jgi:hypothetical protein